MSIDDALSEEIIGCAFHVANVLGPGFLEKIYENALAHELQKAGHPVARQQGIEVHYDGTIVGAFVADLIVADRIIVEIKATRDVLDLHAAQCLNYLKATGLPVCLLLNFGKARIEVRRFARPQGFLCQPG